MVDFSISLMNVIGILMGPRHNFKLVDHMTYHHRLLLTCVLPPSYWKVVQDSLLAVGYLNSFSEESQLVPTACQLLSVLKDPEPYMFWAFWAILQRISLLLFECK
jgi:hypothetical protein